jgi:serine/threonine protein kinase
MIGSTISHYQILEKLGEGGMGVVYKAQDTKLDRLVALKFLPQHLSANEQDKARFIQEAKAAAALNHPNICTIHGIEEYDGQTYIVMEFVEGQTLRERFPVGAIHESPLQIKQAIEIGIQLADGLAAAHEKGIVHRDLKPENIMLQKDGRVKIMDFGLAKLKGASRLTKTGSTVGTTGYMSPEQVQGLDTDHRTDIFSLGVILYELFAGRSPFKGVHETAINYEIVNVEADPISSVKPEIDQEVDSIVLDCLAKDPMDRYQSVAEVGRNLRRFKRESSRSRVSRISQAGRVTPPSGIQDPVQIESTRKREKFQGSALWMATSALLFVVALLVSFVHFREEAPERPVIRFTEEPPARTRFDNRLYNNFSISPDGRIVAFAGIDSLNKRKLWVRYLSSQEAQPLAGTEGAALPFWSPDSRFIGFFADGKLKKINVAGGPAITLCDASSQAGPRGGAWSKEGLIVFAPDGAGPLYRVSSSGGVPVQLTSLDTTKRETSHRFPFFLPDGKIYLYARVSPAVSDAVRIFARSVDGKTDTLIVEASSFALFAQGHLLYARDQTLMAQPFDPDGLSFTGEAYPVAEDVAVSSQLTAGMMFSASDQGTLLYQQGSGRQGVQLAWFDRLGRKTGSIGNLGLYDGVRISPDGRQVAVTEIDPKVRASDIWIYDLTRAIRTRFTFDLANDFLAVWSPTGDEIVFASNRGGKNALFKRPADGTSPETLLLATDINIRPSDWSSDGKFIAFFSLGNPMTRTDIWVLPLVGDGKPYPFLQTEFNEGNPRFSPEGRWLAYSSDESGQTEVYVRPFPGPGPKWQVSTGGGRLPRWRKDGKEILYLDPENKLMAATVSVSGARFEVSNVQQLFQTSLASFGNNYDVTADGQRFIIISTPEGHETASLNVVVNWDAEMKKK